MTESQINEFKDKLKEEKGLLEKELSQVARRNTTNPSDWVPSAKTPEQSKADENLASDSFENLENNIGITTQLENRLEDVNDALTKIENGTYGICEAGDHPIEIERLEVNPAARTCKEHM